MGIGYRRLKFVSFKSKKYALLTSVEKLGNDYEN